MRKIDEVLLDNLIYGNPIIADKYRNAWKRIKKEKCTRSTDKQQLKQAIVLLDKCYDALTKGDLKKDVNCFIIETTARV